MIPTLEWLPEGVNFLDQTKLPLEETYVLATDYKQVATVIKDMIVRGALAIGVSAAMGVALGIERSKATTLADLTHRGRVICEDAGRDAAHRRQSLLGHRRDSRAATTRWPRRTRRLPRSSPPSSRAPGRCTTRTSPRASRWERIGAALLPMEGAVLTHCNAGALATCGYGTALGVIRAAIERGHKISVFADETRPFLQGARLTAWELMKDNIPTTVICDNMAAALMRQGRIQAVIVGSDRIAANGDVANKIGTYGLAVLAREHGIPFYVAAPWSTIDLATSHGDLIPIEQRAPGEVTHINGRQMTPDGVGIENPAFDVTPGEVCGRHHHRARRAARALRGVGPRHGDQPAPSGGTGARVGPHRPPSFFLADPHGTWSDSRPAG